MSDRTHEQHAAFLQAFISDVEDTIAAPMPADLGALQEARDTVSALARQAADTERLREALRLIADGPDPMHPRFNQAGADVLMSVKIVAWDALGNDDPGDVAAARAALDASPPADTEQP